MYKCVYLRKLKITRNTEINDLDEMLTINK